MVVLIDEAIHGLANDLALALSPVLGDGSELRALSFRQVNLCTHHEKRLRRGRAGLSAHGAPHVWSGDRDLVPPDDLNPDCLWFAENAGGQPPQCAKRRPLIDPTRQKEITRHALLAFFDAYLKDDADALRRLDAIGETFAEVTLRQELATP